MINSKMTRRNFVRLMGSGAAVAPMMARGGIPRSFDSLPEAQTEEQGAQRLILERLREWEGWRYGMFISFGMSTFVANELPDGRTSPATYSPDKLDVDSWVQVARDAGMAYVVLTTKHVAGHCLWPSKYTDYSVANSGDRTDVVGAFVKACAKHGVKPGLYYCSWDNHNRFGSVTPSDGVPWDKTYTTSIYQTFQTNQITELLIQYGPVAEMWVDIPSVLGRGYRTYIYERIAELQPTCFIMMNSGISDQSVYNIDFSWPSDLISIERRLPPPRGHLKWREIEGKKYYMPGEVCDTIGKEWFYVEGDQPRPDRELADIFVACRDRGVNLLLDVPPDKHGLIPRYHQDALERLRKNAGV